MICVGLSIKSRVCLSVQPRTNTSTIWDCLCLSPDCSSGFLTLTGVHHQVLRPSACGDSNKSLREKASGECKKKDAKESSLPSTLSSIQYTNHQLAYFRDIRPQTKMWLKKRPTSGVCVLSIITASIGTASIVQNDCAGKKDGESQYKTFGLFLRHYLMAGFYVGFIGKPNTKCSRLSASVT